MVTRKLWKSAKMSNVLWWLLCSTLSSCALGQLSGLETSSSNTRPGPTSPCPNVFTYDPRELGSGKWTGVIKLSTTVKLVGFNLDIKLDRNADLMGNWQGLVETDDNTRFTISSATKKINPGPPLSLRIFVKHGTRSAPNIISIKLNGRKICPGSGSGPARPPVTTTTMRPTPRPVAPPNTPRPVAPPNTPRPVAPQNNPRPVAQNTPRPVAQNTPRPNYSTPTKPIAASQAAGAAGVAECGRVQVAQPLISQGQGTERGHWPWHVALYQSKGKDLTYICGGSLIGLRAVVTAAHCVTKGTFDRAVDPDTLVLYFGKYHLLSWSEGGVQNKQIQQVIVHPTYNGTNFQGDLAILTLKSPVQYTLFVRPVCLWPAQKTGLDEVVGKEGTVVGWGYNENGEVSQDLMLAKMPVVSQDTCIYSYPEFFAHFTNSLTFCAGFRNGTSVCNGDSGGGLFFPTLQKDKTHTWYLRGLVSLSPSKGSGGTHMCGDTNHYVVFTDLAKHLPWITPYVTLK